TIIDNEFPPHAVVSIEATQRIAEESSQPLRRLPLVGEFRISRNGPTNEPLSVFVLYSGTATPGEDYPHPPLLVTIPAGAYSSSFQIVPNDDHISEGIETLVATISNCPSSGLRPPCYDFEIDPAHESATVFIRDDGITEAILAITKPKDGENFPPGDTILIEATAIDLEGYIGYLELWDGEQRLTTIVIDFFRAPDPGTPIQFSFPWRNAASGPHVLTVRSTRPDGTLLKSAPVHITVGPVTNQLPRLAITRPAAGSEFPPDTAIEIVAEGIDPDGLIRKVEFFADGRKIGEQNIEFIQPPEPGRKQTFEFVWRFSTPGPHILTARVTDDDDAIVWSAPIEIRVTTPDLLPIVRVVARDAFAVEPMTDTELNTATFRIRRFGPTNEELVVNYSLHGSAENGVDYEKLSGLALIPAGQRYVTVSVRPLAD